MELPDKLYDRIVALSEKGDAFAEKEQFSSALNLYNEALALLPEPKLDWEAALWLYAAIGDAHFNKRQLNYALDAYQQALQAPEGFGNAYIWFSIGQVFYEWENMPKAKEHFLRAYMLDGDEIFEDQDEAYRELIKDEIEKSPSEPGSDEPDKDKGPGNKWLPPGWEQ